MPRNRSSFKPRSSKVETTETASEDSKTSFWQKKQRFEVIADAIKSRETDLVTRIDARHFAGSGKEERRALVGLLNSQLNSVERPRVRLGRFPTSTASVLSIHQHSAS